MKIKNISIILVIILMMTIIGCNNEISNNEGGTDSSIVELPVFNIGKSGNKNYYFYYHFLPSALLVYISAVLLNSPNVSYILHLLALLTPFITAYDNTLSNK